MRLQGADSTIVAQDGKVQTFAVDKLDKSALVDTNGAGKLCGRDSIARIQCAIHICAYVSETLKPYSLAYMRSLEPQVMRL